MDGGVRYHKDRAVITTTGPSVFSSVTLSSMTQQSSVRRLLSHEAQGYKLSITERRHLNALLVTVGGVSIIQTVFIIQTPCCRPVLNDVRTTEVQLHVSCIMVPATRKL